MLSFSLRPLFSLARESREAPPVILVTLEPGKTDTAIDLFLNSYDGTVLSEQNVIAPGTENSVCVRFTEPHGTAFSYRACLKAEVLQNGTPSETRLPLLLAFENDPYQSFADWYAEGDGIQVCSGSLGAGEDGMLRFSWKWDFERGADPEDTALAALEGLSAIVHVIVITEADEPTKATETETASKETEPSKTAAPPKTTAAPRRTTPSDTPRNNTPFGVDDSPLGIIVILGVAAAAGVLLIIFHKHSKTRNE